MVAKFQFHKGAIRTQQDEATAKDRPNFNSIKVRLEHQRIAGKNRPIRFQFHKGAIRTN